MAAQGRRELTKSELVKWELTKWEESAQIRLSCDWTAGMDYWNGNFFYGLIIFRNWLHWNEHNISKKVIAQLNLKEVIQNHTHPKHKNETQRISKIAHTIQ